MSKKWYVVWVGTEPGICETWEECQIRTQGYPGVRYKAFDSSREAIEAYRKELDAHADPRAVIRAIAHAETSRTNYANINVVPAIKRVNGVGECQCFSQKDYTMRLWIDPVKMKSYGLIPTDLTGSSPSPRSRRRGTR